jgi:hypothetical protein
MEEFNALVFAIQLHCYRRLTREMHPRKKGVSIRDGDGRTF